MASGAKEGTGESGSAAGAGPLKAAVGSECPICLGAVRKPAFVAYCMHQFCFRCIRHWAQAREDCPVCRQSLEQVLHSVRGLMTSFDSKKTMRLSGLHTGTYGREKTDGSLLTLCL
uniref:RING-type E3 ubiquitin transferase n=1 Tax=Cyanistes caeruleus TaxID=156563 RepID=A0A8C0ZF08_CYACU